MSMDEVREFLRSASREDLNNLSAFMKLRRDQLDAEVGMSFVYGEPVEFDAKNRGMVSGKFMGIKRKNATVITDTNVQWTVSPSLLRKPNKNV